MKRNKNDNIRIGLISLMFILLLSCNSTEDRKSDLSAKQVGADSSVIPIRVEDIGKPQNYIDSLNALKDFKNMPYFLKDSCMDANVIYWKDLHHPVSIRKYILENTNNIGLLKYIVQNNLYKNKCNSASPNSSIPYYNLSWNDMVKERLDSLLKMH